MEDYLEHQRKRKVVEPKQENSSKGLFGAPKQENSSKGLFGAPKQENSSGELFGHLINDNQNPDNSLKIPRNNKNILIPKDIKHCIHENDFICYNIDKKDIKSGLLCYNCL